MDLQFYPTPPEVGKRLVSMIHELETPLLEPSAGTGDLLETAIKAHVRNPNHYEFTLADTHCVEIDQDRAATLRGKHFKVVWNDFLTFNPVTPYRTIIMNPPFNDGATHLLRALNILSDGGELACILNAETIKNPYSNERQILIQQLEACEEYHCEFVQDAFAGVDVEVALIHVKKKAPTVRCETFENFKRLVLDEAQEQSTALIHGETDNTKREVLLYQAVVKSALHLFDELNVFNSMVKKLDEVTEVFEMKNRFEERYYLVKKINGAFWKKFLFSEELARLMTNDVRNAYSSKLNEMREYEFNEVNILQLKSDLVKNLTSNVSDAIMKVWRNFTSRFSWRDEKSPNVHYYNGWKTNNAFKCNPKVIIPLYAFSTWTQKLELYQVRGELSDIEKAMNYLDCGRTEDSDMANKLEVAQARGISRGIDTKYFTVDLFKKGTCHLKFKDLELLKKFNIYCGKREKMLPDDYGYKPYDELDDEEKAVADSFEGRDSYMETYTNQQFYLNQDNVLLLTSG